MALKVTYSHFGDKAIRICFGETVDEVSSRKAVHCFHLIEKEGIAGIIDIQNCYNSMLILYDPLLVSPAVLMKRISRIVQYANGIALPSFSSEYHVIPTIYGGEYGPDLEDVAKYHGITPEEVIRIHTKEPLRIYYPAATVCNLTPEKIITPRKANPRLHVPQGSVAIGGKHTGIYMLKDLPGGWNIIGRTPLSFYNPLRIPPFKFKIGDYLHYRRIDEDEYKALELSQHTTFNCIAVKSPMNGTKVFQVIEPGLFSIIQDIGRYHYRRFGIPNVGPMDSFSFRIGNIMVGNRESEAALEVTVLGPELIALSDSVIAITGGDLGFMINDEPAPMWEAIGIRKGDVIKSKGLRRGCRAYISISGGIDVPEVMGSKATSLSYRIGGIGGRILRSGDFLASGVSKTNSNYIIGRRISKEIAAKVQEIIPKRGEITCMRVIISPFADHFTSASIGTFLNSDYIITPQADRTGYRLEGPHIKHSLKGADIVTSAIVPGAIQIPGNGQPLIFLDERTSGGYAVIAVIISADLYKLGQLKPGDAVRFKRTSIEKAHLALREHERNMHHSTTAGAPRQSEGGRNILNSVMENKKAYLIL